MADHSVRFPIKFTERLQNRMGRRAVICAVSERWLRFPAMSTRLPHGEYMFVDVMTGTIDDAGEGKPRKLATLCISKEDLVRAMSHVELDP